MRKTSSGPMPAERTDASTLTAERPTKTSNPSRPKPWAGPPGSLRRTSAASRARARPALKAPPNAAPPARQPPGAVGVAQPCEQAHGQGAGGGPGAVGDGRAWAEEREAAVDVDISVAKRLHLREAGGGELAAPGGEGGHAQRGEVFEPIARG